MKWVVLLSSFRFTSSVLESGLFWIFFWFSSNTVFDVIFFSQIFYFITELVSVTYRWICCFLFVCLFVFFAIVLITKNCLIIKDLKAMISVFNMISVSCLLIFVLSATKFSLFFIDGVSQFTGSGSYSSVALGRTWALTK